MKVIFIKDLRGQGKINDIKEVKDGYATNFLIKNGYAVQYSKTSLSILDTDMEKKKKKDEQDVIDATKLKDKLEKEQLIFYLSSGKNGKTFGSVSNKQISEELSKIGYKIDKKKIIINLPISSIGTHIVELVLHKKVIAKLNIVIKQK